MARMSRAYLDGIAQHVIQRGNNREACFYADEDYAFYLQTLKECSEKYGVAIHAFVLMTNHVHLLVTPQDRDSLPRMMQAIGRRYVRYINIQYRRTGTLWEGRYKSCLVGGDRYLLNVSRYIELNPVRALMVALPGEYPWCSYRHNAMGIHIQLISEHIVYQRLGASKQKRIMAYRSLFDSPLSDKLIEEIRLAQNKEWVLGDVKFLAQVEKALDRKIIHRGWGGDRRSKR